MNPPRTAVPSSRGGKTWRRFRNATLVAAIGGLVLAMTPSAAFADETEYVALGDSYSSGTGTRDYIDDGSDCERSTLAHPYLYAEQIGADLDFQACSGALIDDVRNNQMGSLSDSTDLVTMGIGGNDTGWVDVLISCGTPFTGDCWDDIAEAEDFIENELPGQLDGLYGEISSAAPNADIVITGYPRLFNGDSCNWLVDLSYEEQMALNDAADMLTSVTSSAASDHGFTFVDVTDAFIGHAVCDDTEYLNGLSNPVGESFHPNVEGHQLGYLPQLP